MRMTTTPGASSAACVSGQDRELGKTASGAASASENLQTLVELEASATTATRNFAKSPAGQQVSTGESSDSAISSSPSSARLSTTSTTSSLSSSSSCEEDEHVGEGLLTRSPTPQSAINDNSSTAAESSREEERDSACAADDDDEEEERSDVAVDESDVVESDKTSTNRARHQQQSSQYNDHQHSSSTCENKRLYGANHYQPHYGTIYPNQQHCPTQYTQQPIHYYHYLTNSPTAAAAAQQQQLFSPQYVSPSTFYHHAPQLPAVYTGAPAAVSGDALTNHQQPQVEVTSTTAPKTSAGTYYQPYIYPNHYQTSSVLPHYGPATAATPTAVYYYPQPPTAFTTLPLPTPPVSVMTPTFNCLWSPTDKRQGIQYNYGCCQEDSAPERRVADRVRPDEAVESYCCCRDSTRHNPKRRSRAQGTQSNKDDAGVASSPASSSENSVEETKSGTRDATSCADGGENLEQSDSEALCQSDRSDDESCCTELEQQTECETGTVGTSNQLTVDRRASDQVRVPPGRHPCQQTQAPLVLPSRSQQHQVYDSNQHYHYYQNHHSMPMLPQPITSHQLANHYTHPAALMPSPPLVAPAANGCPLYWQPAAAPQVEYYYPNRYSLYQQPMHQPMSVYYKTTAEHLPGALFSAAPTTPTAPAMIQQQHHHQDSSAPGQFRHLPIGQLVLQLPIEMEPTKTRQAYGMDKVWQEEFELLFSQFSQISDIMWHLVEVETNPNILDSKRIVGYKSRYLVQLMSHQEEAAHDDEAGDSCCSEGESAKSEVESGVAESKSSEDSAPLDSENDQIPSEVDGSECDSGTVVAEADSTSGNSCEEIENVEEAPERKATSTQAGRKFPIRFKMFIDSAKVRFCCDNCGHGWTSMKGRVVFWYELFELVGDNESNDDQPGDSIIGYCAYKLFGQQCDLCKIEGRFERPMWYPEEVTKVLNNLYNKIGQIYFGFRMPTIDKQRRAGKPKTSHNSSLCQACHDGVCTDRK